MIGELTFHHSGGATNSINAVQMSDVTKQATSESPVQ
jgi:hypothetical protein